MQSLRISKTLSSAILGLCVAANIELAADQTCPDNTSPRPIEFSQLISPELLNSLSSYIESQRETAYVERTNHEILLRKIEKISIPIKDLPEVKVVSGFLCKRASSAATDGEIVILLIGSFNDLPEDKIFASYANYIDGKIREGKTFCFSMASNENFETALQNPKVTTILYDGHGVKGDLRTELNSDIIPEKISSNHSQVTLLVLNACQGLLKTSAWKRVVPSALLVAESTNISAAEGMRASENLFLADYLKKTCKDRVCSIRELNGILHVLVTSQPRPPAIF